MIDFTAGTIARLEYEEKLRSRAPILDCDDWIQEDQPSRMSFQIKYWVCALKFRLAAVGERLKHKPVTVPDSPRTRQKQSGVLS